MKTFKINIPEDRNKLYEVIRYPAGEIQVRLTSAGIQLAGLADGYIISANPIPDIIELAQLKDALDALPKKWFWKQLDLMYLPYARADRRFVLGDSYGLEVFARLINSLNFNSVYTFDVHSRVAGRLINNLVNLDPVTHYDEIKDVIQAIGRRGLVLVLPDKGAAGRYDLSTFKLPTLVGEKVREAGSGKLSGFSISTEIAMYDKALIVDDICDGGGTFIGLAEEIRNIDSEIKLYLYVSHGIFSQGLDKLHQTFDQVFVSDYSFKSEYSETFTDIIRRKQ